MLVIGAKGFAKEVLEIAEQLNNIEGLVFYDDVNVDIGDRLYGKFPILKSIEEASNYFNEIDKRFCIGIGNPVLRKTVCDKFITLGGNLVSTISPKANLGTYEVEIGNGSNILDGVVFSNSSKVGVGCIVYYNTIITHDCIIGDFVEISPSVTVLGRSHIGSYSQIGSNATILPDITIGRNVIVGAGSVVTKNVPDNSVVVGIPAKVIRKLEPLAF